MARTALRLVFAAMFLGQSLVALVVLVTVAAVAGPQASSGPALGAVLILLGILQVPFAPVLAVFAVRAGGKRGGLYGTLLSAVLLSTLAWYGAFALLTGQRPAALVLAALLMIGYALGFLLTGRFARLAASFPSKARD